MSFATDGAAVLPVSDPTTDSDSDARLDIALDMYANKPPDCPWPAASDAGVIT